jgi:lipopolysaccharide-induced tumor necrosis factor-alpha factor
LSDATPLPPTGAPLIKCPKCNYQGPAIVTKKLSSGGWVLFCVLLIFCIPICWLPFVLNGCKVEAFKCGSCGTKIA